MLAITSDMDLKIKLKFNFSAYRNRKKNFPHSPFNFNVSPGRIIAVKKVAMVERVSQHLLVENDCVYSFVAG